MARDDGRYMEYQEPMPYPYGSVPIPQKVDRADFIEKIKPEHVAEIIRHKLMGEELLNEKWTKIPALQENAISEYGAWELSNMILAAGSINVSISRLKEAQINARLKNLIKEALIKMLSNWREYNINNIGQMYYVKSIMMSNGLAVLSQAGEGSIQELFKTSVSEQRMISTEKKEPSKLRRLFGMGRE